MSSDKPLARPVLSASDATAGRAFRGLDDRTRTIFRLIVETYIETGEPVGSRNLSRGLPMTLSPASVRNVMSDLERLGLIFAPHTSAGRLPTETGLRLFVDGMLEVGNLGPDERARLDAQVKAAGGKAMDRVLSEAVELVSGLSECAGLVVVDKEVNRVKHVEFVGLEPGKALVVLVGEDQKVENRLIDLPRGLPPSALVEATNYLNARVRGLTLGEARIRIEAELTTAKAELDKLTQKVVKDGLATWAGALDDRKSLIVRGQANLLKGVEADVDFVRIRQLFQDLEEKRDLIQLLGLAEQGDGVSIFIGSENKLFSLSGSSVIAAPFRDTENKIVGIVGVIGPTRLNYARIIPMVDYTARLVARLLT
ncbi:MAG: HrcA family transcriptional regulator [Pseudomonadota bacterium]